MGWFIFLYYLREWLDEFVQGKILEMGVERLRWTTIPPWEPQEMKTIYSWTGNLWIVAGDDNFQICMGKNPAVCFHFGEDKTIIKRLKWWLFCRFFPFKIDRWDKR